MRTTVEVIAASTLLLIIGCAPRTALTPAPGSVTSQQAGHHVLLLEDSELPPDLAASITHAGGTLSGSLPEFGVAFASSTDARFVERASLIAGVRGVTPDVGERLVGRDRRAAVATAGESTSLADDDELYRLQWAHVAMDVPRAWALGARGAGVRVVVIDDGIDVTHPDLAGRINKDLSRSFVPGVGWDDPPSPKRIPGGGWHGTSVASVLAAADNGTGMIGVAPEAELVLLRAGRPGPPDKASFTWLLNALSYAVDIDADVVNLSIAAPVPTAGGCIKGGNPRIDVPAVCLTAEEVATLVDAFNRVSRRAWENDTLILAGSGNFSTTVTADDGLTFLPAEADYVLPISATGPEGWGENQEAFLDHVMPYSNVGDGFIAFAAPGGRPRSEADGTGDCTVGPTTPRRCLDRVVVAEPNGYPFAAGTSLASPHAAGVAALILSVLPEKSAPLVLALMRMGADDLGPPGRDAGYGFGRLNAGNSVQLALALQEEPR